MVSTIDEIMKNYSSCDYIKIDTEGSELLCVDGAVETIKKYKPIITLESWKDHYGSVDINYTKELFKNLLDIGYDIEHIIGPDFLFVPNNYIKTE